MKSLLSKFKGDALNASQVTSCHWAGLFIIHVIFWSGIKNPYFVYKFLGIREFPEEKAVLHFKRKA